MALVAKAIRPLAPNEIPRGAGLCVSDGAYIALPVGADGYDATISAPGMASIDLGVVERGESGKGYISDSGFAGRAARTEIAGMKGEEIRLRNDERSEYAAIVSDLDREGLNGAEVAIELRVYDRANLPEGIGDPDDLWDNIARSIRRKP